MKTGINPVHGFGINDVKQGIKVQLRKVRELSDKVDILTKLVNKARTIEEILAINWALDQYVPLYYKRKPWFSAYILFYERLFLQPRQELRRLLKRLNISLDETNFAKVTKLMRKSSASSRNCMVTGYEHLIRWKKGLSRDKVARILRILEKFEITFYDEDPEPDYSASSH